MAGTPSRRARRIARGGSRHKRILATTLVLVMLAALTALVGVAPSGAVSTPEVVGPNDVLPPATGYWASPSGSDTGTVAFTAGTAPAGGGAGSLALGVTSAQHRSYYNYKFGICSNYPACTAVGTPLSSITALSYWALHTSGDAGAIPSLNIEVDPDSTGAGPVHYTTLVWEPSNNGGSVTNNVWQNWDALLSGNAKFWSTALINGYTTAGVGGDLVTWNAIKAANPNAAIKYGIGPNIGTGPNFQGNVDLLSVGIGGNTTVFNFEPTCTTSCFVSTTGNDTNTGQANDPFLTIQKGIDTVSAGGTVTVAAGTYTGGQTINKSLTLKGANFGVNGTATRGAESVVQVLSGGADVFDVQTPNPVTIDGFTTKFTGTQQVGGILNDTQASNIVTFTHNIVRDSIYVNALVNITQSGTATVSNNKFMSIDQQGSPGSCVLCTWGNPSQQANIVVQANTFMTITDDDGVPAININDAGGTVSGNTFNNIEQYGILLADNLANLSITGNTFNLIHNSSPQTSNNRGSGIRTFAVPNFTGPVNITGNTFSNSYHGVRVANDGSPATIPSNFKINRNAFITNVSTGISVDPTTLGPSIDGTCNWWNSQTPESDAGVTTTPYLTSGNLAAPCTGGVPMPVITVHPLSVIEGNSGMTAANVPVTLSSTYPLPITFKYATANGTATQPVDYPKLSGTLTIPANTSSAVIPLKVNGGVQLEDNQTFRVDVSAPTNATLANPSATITILNDELPKITVTAPGSTEGANTPFTITLKQHYAYPLTLHVTTVAGTAASPGDYTALNLNYVFAAQDVGPHSIPVVVKTDGLKEGVEKFSVTVTGGESSVTEVTNIAKNTT